MDQAHTWKYYQQRIHKTFFNHNYLSWGGVFRGLIMRLSEEYREEHLALKSMNE